MTSFKYKSDFSLDDPGRTQEHRATIQSKVFLNKLYREWYETFVLEKSHLPTGPVIEIGSGGGFLKKLIPDIITSDILPLPSNDMTFSALEMPFPDSSVSGIFMVDTFHHLPDARLFLSEVNRVLKKSGKLIMIEPANSLWGRFIFQRFHHEPFDPDGTWQIPGDGPLSQANGCLLWIVFERDKRHFTSEFPGLEVEMIQYHTPLRYLLSGGVSFKQFVPDGAFNLFRAVDRILAALSKQTCMFMTLKIIKTKEG